MFNPPTREQLSSVSAEAARLAIQSGTGDCPARQTLTAQALLDQGLHPVEVGTVLTAMHEEHTAC